MIECLIVRFPELHGLSFPCLAVTLLPPISTHTQRDDGNKEHLSTMQAAVNDQMDLLDDFSFLIFRLLDMLKSAGIMKVREEPLISVHAMYQYAFNIIMYV